jgi:hypothetical protein
MAVKPELRISSESTDQNWPIGWTNTNGQKVDASSIQYYDSRVIAIRREISTLLNQHLIAINQLPTIAAPRLFPRHPSLLQSFAIRDDDGQTLRDLWVQYTNSLSNARIVNTDFRGVNSGDSTLFHQTHFLGLAQSDNAEFGYVSFLNATLHAASTFGEVRFTSITSFQGVTLSGRALFGSQYVPAGYGESRQHAGHQQLRHR